MRCLVKHNEKCTIVVVVGGDVTVAAVIIFTIAMN
jgi:hypothetical protein